MPRALPISNLSTVMSSLMPAMTPEFMRETRSLQASRNQQFHDLVGARIYAQYARVAIHPRDRIFVHIAIPAEQLQASVDHFALRVGEAVFGHRGGNRVEFALDMPLDAMVEEDFGDCRIGLALGKLELRVLKLNNRLAEGLALFDIVDGERER